MKYFRALRTPGTPFFAAEGPSVARLESIEHDLLCRSLGYRVGQSVIAEWETPTVRLVTFDGGNKLSTKTDAPYFLSFPCLSESVASVFRQIVEPASELLELRLRTGELFYVIHKVFHPAPFNWLRTKFVVENGKNIRISDVVFQSGFKAFGDVFGIGHWACLDWLVVSSVFVERWKAMRLRGVDFQPIDDF